MEFEVGDLIKNLSFRTYTDPNDFDINIGDLGLVIKI